MAGSFLFTQNTAGRHGGRNHVQPLLRAATNNIPTFDTAVANATAQQLVATDGTTVYMAADVAFMAIGRKSELRDELAPDDVTMTYQQIRSADRTIDLTLCFMRYKPSVTQTDYLYVLAGPAYWTGTVGADLTAVPIADVNGRSPSLDLGTNPAGNARDPSKIIDHINRLTN